MSCSTPTQGSAIPQQKLPNILVNGRAIEEAKLAAEVQYHPADSFNQSLHEAAHALIIRELLLQRTTSLGMKIGEQDNADEILIQALLEKDVEYPEADEATCLQYYQSNQSQFVSSPLLEVSHILLAVGPKELKERDQTRSKAEAIIQQLQKNPALFNTLVEQHSDCPSSKTQGILGQLSKGQTTPEFERQLFTLNVGLAGKPIESRYGFHVVRVDQKIDGEVLPFNMVRDKVATYLSAVGERRAVSTYLRKLVADAEVTGINLKVDSASLEILHTEVSR